MRALTWQGRHKVQVDTVPDPEIVNPRDAIIKVTSTAICGSDLHLYDGYIPTMRAGDILGHEFMGEVVETGPKSTLARGQRVVVPFTISCGSCFFCGKEQYAACDNANPATTSDMSETLYGYPMGGAFGYAHLTGGYAGGQAEYVRVPYSDVGPIVDPGRARGRQGPVPLRHPADRLDGGGECADRGGRHGRGLGLRPGRAVRGPVGFASGRAPGDRDRPLSAPARARQAARRRSARLSRHRHSRSPVRDDRRHRARRLHRLRRHGEPRARHRQSDRHGEGAHLPRHRPAGGAPPGDPRLPQGRPRSPSPASMAAWPTNSRSAR